MQVERRKQRSRSWDESLHLWLHAVARRSDISGMVLADSSGLVLACSEQNAAVEEIAALAPLLARPDRTGTLPAQSPEIPVTVQEMVVDSNLLYLCAVGDEDRCELGLEKAAPGVRRILNN